MKYLIVFILCISGCILDVTMSSREKYDICKSEEKAYMFSLNDPCCEEYPTGCSQAKEDWKRELKEKEKDDIERLKTG